MMFRMFLQHAQDFDDFKTKVNAALSALTQKKAEVSALNNLESGIGKELSSVKDALQKKADAVEVSRTRYQIWGLPTNAAHYNPTTQPNNPTTYIDLGGCGVVVGRIRRPPNLPDQCRLLT